MQKTFEEWYQKMREIDDIAREMFVVEKAELRRQEKTAKKMLEKNEPIEKIIEYTDLTLEQIEDIINKP